jgi:site-specific DNA-methyltransferase (adenine-specific)
MIDIYDQNNLTWLSAAPADKYHLIYVDPPFNTGHTQRRGDIEYTDKFAHDDYISWMRSLMLEAKRVLVPTGSIFVHLDYREVHYVKVMLDDVFGRECFKNEIIWAYDYGGRSKSRWSAKHDNILWYVRDPKNYTFNFDQMDRIPYMAPGLVGVEKAARGKTPTDHWSDIPGSYWWHTIVPTNGKEKTGYPTQKPLGILNRIVKVHSNPGDQLLDFFAGSGSFGEAGASLDRHVTLIDNNPKAITIMMERFRKRLDFTFHNM